MSIEQIKEHLRIGAVLNHYNLEVDKNGMLNCPFHEDKKASMRVYEKTDTVYCFAGGCEVDHADVIDLVMYLENCSKHKAIEKCKTLIGKTSYPIISPKPKPLNPPCMKTAYQRYLGSIKTYSEAQVYCKARCLNWSALGIGYKSRKTRTAWGRGCLIFALMDGRGEVVSLYGRPIAGDGHYYQSGRNGLYPAYPNATAKVLILCESIIDTASLLQLSLPFASYALLSLYGTNGLTEEHLEAIGKMEQLEEIIFALDGDEAGKKATGDHAKTLNQVLPGVQISTLILPEEEDINSLYVSHENKQGLFTELFTDRQVIQPKQPTKPIAMVCPPKLNSSNPHNLIYTTALARYYIKGGIRYGLKDLDSLKVTLVVENEVGLKSPNKLDMYEDKQVEKVARIVAEKLGLRTDLLELDMQALTDELEKYREGLQNDNHQDRPKIKVPIELRQKCLDFLRGKDLIKSIDAYLELYGLIGEVNNRRLGFCLVSSYGMPNPLHGLIQGSSGSGKTHLLSKLCALIPPEHYIPITRATDNSFYNYGPYELKNKLISVEDKDSMSEEANLAFRELQSKGMVSTSTTGQDEHGNNRSYIKQVFGPIASLACTTKGELYLDDMNRCFLLAVDESAAQTKNILDYQKREAAGLVNKQKRKEIETFIQYCLRLLKPYEVVIPYAPKISLPQDVKDKRRLNSLYLSLVKQLTLLHQYQRQKDSKGRLISTLEDLQLANEIMFDAIVLKVDELYGPLRSFYEKVKNYLTGMAKEQAKEYSFRQREIRQALRLSRSSATRFFRELLEMEYIQIVGGSERRGYQYKVSYWDDNAALRDRIQDFLGNQINQFKLGSDPE